MPLMRNTHPRLVTDPTMKPMLAPPRHWSTPTCTRCAGCCASAAPTHAVSMVAAIAARTVERRIRKLPIEKRMACRGLGVDQDRRCEAHIFRRARSDEFELSAAGMAISSVHPPGCSFGYNEVERRRYARVSRPQFDPMTSTRERYLARNLMAA